MPPKLKGKTQKKKKVKKQKDGSGSIEEQFRRATLEVDVLQDHLALRTQVTRRTQDLKEELQVKLQELEKDLEGERDEKQAVYNEMTRQHRTLEQESSERIQSLEKEVAQLKSKLGFRQNQLVRQQKKKLRSQSYGWRWRKWRKNVRLCFTLVLISCCLNSMRQNYNGQMKPYPLTSNTNRYFLTVV